MSQFKHPMKLYTEWASDNVNWAVLFRVSTILESSKPDCLIVSRTLKVSYPIVWTELRHSKPDCLNWSPTFKSLLSWLSKMNSDIHRVEICLQSWRIYLLGCLQIRLYLWIPLVLSHIAFQAFISTYCKEIRQFSSSCLLHIAIMRLYHSHHSFYSSLNMRIFTLRLEIYLLAFHLISHCEVLHSS